MADLKISLCLIVKNEAKMLPRCIDSFQESFDELIVVDTGSSDDTIKIAESLGAKTFCFEWKNDFSKARQFAFDQATSDMILWCDADDILRAGDGMKIRNVVN